MMVMVSGRKGRIKQLLICYRRFTGIHYTCIMHTCVITYFVFAVIMVHGRNVFCISNILCASAQLQATIRKKKIITNYLQKCNIRHHKSLYHKMYTHRYWRWINVFEKQNQKKITCDANVRTWHYHYKPIGNRILWKNYSSTKSMAISYAFIKL